MKKFVLIVAIMVYGIAFSQSSNPVLEENGQLVKATYYYANGNVQQVGYFKDGKLDGKWTSYDANGNIKAVAEYTNGEKSGKWIFSDAIATKEVDYSNNQIVAVRNNKANALANKN